MNDCYPIDEKVRLHLAEVVQGIRDGRANSAVVEVVDPMTMCDGVFWLLHNGVPLLTAVTPRTNLGALAEALAKRGGGVVCLTYISTSPPDWFRLFHVASVAHASWGTA